MTDRSNEDPEVAELLSRLANGEQRAADQLFVRLQRELRRLAGHCMRGQPNGHTLQPTALVNEAFIKIVGGSCQGLKDERHFLFVAARAMRSILVDHARAKNRQKRKAEGERVPLDSLLASYEERGQDIVALDEHLTRLREFDTAMADAVDLHFFGGRTLAETAKILDIKLRTFERRWKTTKAWLLNELLDEADGKEAEGEEGPVSGDR